VGANVTGAGNFNIGDRSMLELGGAVAAGQTISFTAGVRGVLRLDSPSNFQGSISGLANGDLIDLVGVTISSASISATTLTVTNPTDTIFLNINQTSSVSLPAPASGSGATPAGVNITTGGASIVLMNAGNISLAGNVNATGGSGIFTNSLTGSTDVINYGNVL